MISGANVTQEQSWETALNATLTLVLKALEVNIGAINMRAG